MSMQILQMFTRITEVKEQQGFSWETLSHIVVVVPAMILFFMTIYRYYTATSLDKFFLEGADKVWMQAGKIIELVIVIGFALFVGTMLPFVVYNMFPGFEHSIYKIVMGFSIIIFPTAFIANRIEYDIGKSKTKESEKRKKSLLLLIIMSALMITAAAIAVDIFWIRYNNGAPMKMVFIKFAADMILLIIYMIGSDNSEKNHNANNAFITVIISSVIGILLYSIDIYSIAKSGDHKGFVPAIICLGLTCVVLIVFMILMSLTPLPCEGGENEVLSGNKKYRDLVEFLLFTIVVSVFGPFILKILGFHALEITRIQVDGTITPEYNIPGFIEQIFEKIPAILFVIFLEAMLLVTSVLKVNLEELGLKSKNTEIKLVDLETGIVYYAYGVINGDIIYGEEKNYGKVKIPRFLPLSYIEGSEGTSENYILVNINMAPIECETKQVLTKFTKRKGVLIDVSNKRTFEREHPSMAKSIPKLTHKGKMWCSIEKTRDRVSALFRSVDIDDIDKNQEILIYHKDNSKAEIAAWRCIIAGYKHVFFTKGAAHWDWEREDGFYSCELVDQTIDEDE